MSGDGSARVSGDRPSWYSYIDKKGQRSDLPPEQEKMIQDEIQKASGVNIQQKGRKIHVRQMSDDSFLVRIDKKNAFHITKTGAQRPGGAGEVPREWIAIRETVRETGFLSSCRDFWKSVVSFFYPSALRDKEAPRRDP